MIKIFSLIIFSFNILQGCSNKYTGIGFPYSISSNQEKIDNIQLPEEGQDVIKATEEILSASVEKIPTITAVGYAVVSTQPGKILLKKTNGY